MVYPKNSIYLCTHATNPSELLGGNWGQHKGALLAATGANSYAKVNTNGGSLKISVNQLPSHNHLSGLKNSWIAYWGTCNSGTIALSNGSNGQWGCCGDGNTTGNTVITATGKGQNYLPYHYSVNCWERTS